MKKRGILSWIMEFAANLLLPLVIKGKHDELMKQNGIYKNFIVGRRQAVRWKLS